MSGRSLQTGRCDMFWGRVFEMILKMWYGIRGGMGWEGMGGRGGCIGPSLDYGIGYRYSPLKTDSKKKGKV